MILFILLACITIGEVNAQSQAMAAEEVIFRIVEQAPEFPGGEKGLYSFLGQNIKDPQGDTGNNEDVTVRVRFVVSKVGAIRKIEITKPAPKVYEDEVIRVMQLMPIWKPGRNNGMAVNSYYTLPIRFTKVAPKKTVEADTVYKVMEQEPWFSNGAEGLKAYFDAKRLSVVEGDKTDAATIEFTINKEGFAEGLSFGNAISKKLEVEITKAIKEMPEWLPGKRNGIAIPWKMKLRLSAK